MIHNLTTNDAMDYTVDLIHNKEQDTTNIRLTVKRKCQYRQIFLFCQSFNYPTRKNIFCHILRVHNLHLVLIPESSFKNTQPLLIK